MSPGQPSSNLYLLKTILAGWFMVTVVSCTFVKKYQANKPFVYETNINLIGNFTNVEKANLTSGLKNQLDDSVRARKIDKLLFSVMKNPPVYDSTSADKSIIFMRAFLNSQGYFSDSTYYGHSIKKKNWAEKVFSKKYYPYRTVVDFYVRPGPQVKLDSISYTMRKPELQRLTDSTRKDAIIKKGDPFAKGPISAELDRLTELYRNNGYLRFTRDQLVGIWDTLEVSLLQPNLGFFEQLQALNRQRQRRQKPTANLEIHLQNIDSVKLTRYYIGNVTIYPDFSIDTFDLERKVDIVKGIKVIQYGKRRFKPSIFPPNIYLPRDSVYRQRRYTRTLNRLNVIGAWRLVNIDQLPRPNQDTVDFVIRLTPAKKQLFTTTLEGSINQSAISGTLFGIGVDFGLQNRNAGRAANFSSTNARYGIEFGNTGSEQFIQTKQISIGNTFYFPRAILFDKYTPENRKDNWRTIFSTNAVYTDRRDLFRLTTLNVSWGYEYQRRKLSLTFKFPNIEYSSLKSRPGLDTILKYNPSLKNIFTDGLIVSAVTNLIITGGKKNGLNVFRANFEGAPYFGGWLHSPFLDDQLYRFMKFDAEFARLVRYRKNSIAMHAFWGIGIADPFNTTINADKRNSLPFFKQYFAGGPNSMRAWALRRLGPGSSVKDFDGQFGTPDRYGDVQLEGNLEFRFPIARLLSAKINGALFTDFGNVWLLKGSAGPPEEVFDFSHLGKDIAIGAGAGLRIDVNIFVLRFDYSYKVKDPSPSTANAALQNKWFGYPFFKGAQFQLGIGYPFIF
jgi:outer membrane protein assembly factor BamA